MFCQRWQRFISQADIRPIEVYGPLALSYGGREEIVSAAGSIAEDSAAGSLLPSEVDCPLFSSRFQTAGIPDPDLLVRTSGEMRVSNFLLWQISYAEIVIAKKF
jgi:undecaprenyl diphosphate synthase